MLFRAIKNRKGLIVSDRTMTFIGIGAWIAGFAVSASAQEVAPPSPAHHVTYGVVDWKTPVPEKAAEFKTFRVIVLSNPNYSDDEKAAKIAAKYAAIRSELRNQRVGLYEAVSEVRTVGNSVTKGSSGGSSKTSDAECVGAAKPNMFTRSDWARGAYKSGGDDAGPGVIASGLAVDPAGIVINDGNLVCAISLKQSGKGRKVSYSEATFRIRPANVQSMVDEEMTALMYAISSTPI